MRDWRDIWRALLPRRSLHRDIDDELTFHIEERIDELVRGGMAARQARDLVTRRFGSRARLGEECRRISLQRIEREEWSIMIDGLWHDIRTALRSLAGRPAASAIVALTMALGIGATTAVFSVVDGVLLRPLPYRSPERLTLVWQNDRATGTLREPASVPDVLDYRELARSFSHLAMYNQASLNLTRTDGEPARVRGVQASHEMLDLLGLPPILGRDITPAEDAPGGDRVVLLSHAFWQAAFGGENVVGDRIDLNDERHTIVGVLDPALEFPVRDFDVWRPLRADPTQAPRSNHGVRVIGRLAAGVEPAAAQREMEAIAAQLEAEYAENANRGVLVEGLREYRTQGVATTLWVLFAAVGSVLLIASANVANLLLAQAAGRARDTAVCVALGAGSGRLARRYLVESLLLTGVSLLGGVALAVAGVRGLLALAPQEVLGTAVVRADGTALAFAVLVSGAIGVGFGLVPTLHARRMDLQSVLRPGRSESGGAGVTWLPLRRLLVVAQVALAVVLLVAAGLLIGTLLNLQRVDLGFSAQNVLRVDLRLPATRYPADFSNWPRWPERVGAYTAMLDRVGALPEVEAVAITTSHPMQEGFTNSFQIVGREYDPEQGEILVRLVTPGYFDTVGSRVVAGRAMSSNDDAAADPVILLNRAAVARYFPEADPLEQQLALPWDSLPRRVVGVIENERTHGLDAAAPPAMYLNLLQAPSPAPITVMARTRTDPMSLVARVREAVWEVDGELPLYNVATMSATLEAATAQERFASTILGWFALIALFLAAIGVYGILNYVVAQRRHEVGVRLALGAARADVMRLVLRQGAGMIAVGAAIGLGGALIASRALRALLFEVEPTEPVTYALVVLALVTAGLVAAAIPARRAASVDPVESLRGD